MTTAPDMLRQFGGAPVGANGFQGWWGDDVWFADFDSGTTGSAGTRPDDAFKYLDDAIAAAGPNDTIYVRPRAPEVGGDAIHYSSDPGDITPKTASTNWTIPWTSYGLSLIGTGIGRGHTGAQRTCLQGDSTITTTAVLTLNAPFCTIENLGFKNGASTTSLIYTKWANDSSTQAGMNTFYNCWFRNTAASDSFKGIRMDSGNYDSIIRCNFSSMDFGIYLESNNSEISSLVVRDCDFLGLTTEINCNIYSTGGAKRVLITGCNMNHAIPAGGSPNLYVSFGATSTGTFSDSYMGAAVTTIGTNTTLNGIFHSGVYTTNGLSDG